MQMAIKYPVTITLVDKAVKPSTVGDLYANEAQLTDYIDDPSAGDLFNWFAAVANLSLAEVTRQGVSVEEKNVVVPPTDDNAYNSAKLKVFWRDATNDITGSFTVPARDAGAFNTYPRTKDVILTIAAGGTAQVEALVSRTNALYSALGGAVSVTSIVIAGGRQ